MIIKDTVVEPGQNTTVRIQVGRLPSDTKIYLNVFVYRSTAPGPTAVFMAGMHGDEVNGVEIVRRTLASKMFEQLKRGSVIVIPVLNVQGFNNFSRDVPDGKDVNRSFPGSATGSMASRVAFMFSKLILPLIDFGVDFHTGGDSHYNYPQIRYCKGHAPSQALAAAFAAPVTVAGKPIPKSLRKTALDAGKPMLVYEGGENLRLDGFSIEKGLAGIRRLLVAKDMLDEAPPAENSLHFDNSTWIRATRTGMFRWSKQAGQKISKGEILGVLNDPYGQEEIPILAKQDGFIIGHDNAPVVGLGDALFHIGY